MTRHFWRNKTGSNIADAVYAIGSELEGTSHHHTRQRMLMGMMFVRHGRKVRVVFMIHFAKQAW